MVPRGGKSLLIALVACVQLALAPAFRPVACGVGGAAPGGRPCCAASSDDVRPEPWADAGDSCCCSEDSTPARAPQRDREPPDGVSPDGVPPDGVPLDDPCPCHHGPQPWAPNDVGVAVSIDASPALVRPGAGVSVPPVDPPTVVPFGARAGPPARAGPALHVLHCVFLI